MQIKALMWEESLRSNETGNKFKNAGDRSNEAGDKFEKNGVKIHFGPLDVPTQFLKLSIL